MRLAPLVFAFAVAASTQVQAQPQMPSLGSLGGASGASGLMGGLAPDLSSMGAGNAAGVIGYCIKNKYLGEGGAAASVMNRLRGGGDSSPGFAAGSNGQLQLGSGSLSMDSLKGKMKTKVCDMVLSHAQSMI